MRHLASFFLIAAVCPPVLSFAQAPASIQPPPSQHPFLTVQGRGAQVYSCQQVGPAFQWSFQAPVARLFDATGNEVGTHGDGPAWIYQDSSSIKGALLSQAPASTPGDIPSLLLKAGNPLRTGILTSTEFITRTDAKGGAAPATGCDPAHKGEITRVPYTATYTFYSSAPAK